MDRRIERSSSSSTPRWNYDVFLSFRGEDTRKNFTDHLYTALVQSGINTFRDDEELRRGEDIASELPKAIEKSRISIIIFSTNYASSSWCLDELVKILECKKTIGQTVLPVFYGVEPSDVRKQSGIFGEIFAKQEERFKVEMEKVESWRSALKEAASLSGWDLQDGYESKFIRSIVDKVLSNLNQTYLHVAMYPVGLESPLRQMRSLLSVGSDDIRIIGICGMGGIGKTTIAKAVFNLLLSSFEGCSFLANVREVSSQQTNGLALLQEQLLSDILMGKNLKITSVDRGVNIISEKLYSKRVLLVLDDVDQLNQLNALVGSRSSFGLGSRIIITTRDAHLLNNFGVDAIYKTRELNSDESLKLFSWHAFRNDHPTKDYLEFSKSIVDYVNGLPLALEVLGSFLFGKSILEYKSTLEKLEKIPYHEIQRKLRISFDALDDDLQKDMFLDIACFFIGMNKDHVIGILDSCNFFPKIGISVLMARSLITINERNQVMMHDLLQDMGREIIREESPKEPGKRSRLWFHDDINNVLTEHTGTKNVEGLSLTMPGIKADYFDTKSFKKMRRLRLIRLSHVHLTGNYEHVSKELRWLCWYGFPLESIPTEFHLENLVNLDLQFSNIKYLWKGIKLLKKLKVLNLSHSHGLTRTPDFSGLPMVEKLILEDCPSLVVVHHSIGQLQRLVFFSLKDCGNLRNLPSSICELKSIENLVLCGCSKLEKLPEELGNMRCLRELLVDNTAIQELPLSIGRLKNLRCLSLNGCKRSSTSKDWNPFFWFWSSLRKIPGSTTLLPTSLSGLSSLGTLNMSYCNLTDDTIPSEIGRLCSLQHLDMSGNKFCSLPASVSRLSQLKSLMLHDCTRLQFLPELPSSLKEFDAAGCTSLEQLSNFERLSSLESLDLSYSNICTLPACLVRFSELSVLRLNNCSRLQVLPELPSGLDTLNVSDCHKLTFLDLNNGHTDGCNCNDLLNDKTSIIMMGRNNLPNNFKKSLFQAAIYGIGCFYPTLPGAEVLDWFSHRSMGSSVFFEVPALLDRKIQGLTACAVGTFSKEPTRIYVYAPIVTINNKSKGHVSEIRCSTTCNRLLQDDLWVTYIPRAKLGCQLEHGDRIEVSVNLNSEEQEQVNKCGVELVYEKDGNYSWSDSEVVIGSCRSHRYAGDGVLYFYNGSFTGEVLRDRRGWSRRTRT